MKKKILNFSLVISIISSLFVAVPITVNAYESEEIFSYNIIDGEVGITGCSEIVSGAIVIPTTIEGYPVTKIGSYVFTYCENISSIIISAGVKHIGSNAFDNPNIKSISIPAGVEKIAPYAFANCTGLTSITIPDGVTDIYEYTFHNCTDLTDIDIPESVTQIGPGAFENCKSLKNIHIPDGVTELSYCVFKSCEELENINIPNGVTDIQWNAFEGCKSLKSIEIPSRVQYIGGYAFADCQSITSITIPYGVTEISENTFYNCIDLTEVDIPDSVERIGNNVFENCKSLTEIEIPDSVTEIYSCAFKSCESLSDITLFESVKCIEDEAFYNCENLTNVYYSGTEEEWYDFRVMGYGNDCLLNANIYFGEESRFDYEIVDGGATITGYATDNKTHTTLRIPATIDGYPVTAIGEFAFHYWGTLTTLTIPDSVTSIGNGAFARCSDLTDIHYFGTQEDWDNIIIGDSNLWLTYATIHFEEKPEQPSYTLGDPNGDDAIDIKDVISIRRFVAGGYDSTIVNKAADINKDGTVDVKDVIALRRFIAGGYGVEL